MYKCHGGDHSKWRNFFVCRIWLQQDRGVLAKLNGKMEEFIQNWRTLEGLPFRYWNAEIQGTGKSRKLGMKPGHFGFCRRTVTDKQNRGEKKGYDGLVDMFSKDSAAQCCWGAQSHSKPFEDEEWPQATWPSFDPQKSSGQILILTFQLPEWTNRDVLDHHPSWHPSRS